VERPLVTAATAAAPKAIDIAIDRPAAVRILAAITAPLALDTAVDRPLAETIAKPAACIDEAPVDRPATEITGVAEPRCPLAAIERPDTLTTPERSRRALAAACERPELCVAPNGAALALDFIVDLPASKTVVNENAGLRLWRRDETSNAREPKTSPDGPHCLVGLPPLPTLPPLSLVGGGGTKGADGMAATG
jgi:hypothetical protein